MKKMTPLQLVYGALVASAVPFTVSTASLLPQFDHLSFAARLIVTLPLFAGLLLTFLFENGLRDGLKGDRWAVGLVAAARSRVHSKAFNIAQFVVIALSFGAAVVSLASHSHHVVAVNMLILPGLAITRLQTLLKPKPQPGPLQDWHNFAPLSSEHWGEASGSHLEH
jgi:hypothetical protein